MTTQKPKCIIEGCEKPQGKSRGWCTVHYGRWWRHGDPLIVLNDMDHSECSVTFCDRKAKSYGMCGKHYATWRRTEDPESEVRYMSTKEDYEVRTHKKCTVCKEMKPLEEFSKDSSRGDGLSYTCKSCQGEAQAAYYVQNREAVLAKNKAHYENDPDYYSVKSRNRMLDKFTTPLSNAKTLAYRKEIKNNPCYYCGETTEQMHYDHYYPLARGGTDHWYNLVRSCASCNLQKGTKLGSEWETILKSREVLV